MKSSHYYRKAQGNLNISSLGSIAIALLIAAVMLGLGATILTKIQGTQSDNTADNGNQSLTWAGNNTAIEFNSDRVNTGSVVLYNNASVVNRGVGDAANYTVSQGSITILNSSNGPDGTNSASWVTSDLNASYSYQFGSQARNSTGFGLSGTVVFAEFIPTIAIVAAAAIVISVLLLMFGRRRND